MFGLEATRDERRGCGKVAPAAMTNNKHNLNYLNSKKLNSKNLSDRPRIVIIGGGYAGMSVTLRLARNSKAEIHLINPQARFVERIRLHEAASGRNLREISIPHLLRGKGVTFHEARATYIDWRDRTVTLSNGTQLEYDRLVYALGSQTDHTTPGVAEHALSLEGLDGAAQMTARLNTLPAQSNVLIVGSGLTGVELATELAERYPHLRWTMVARSAFEQGYAPAAREYFLKALARRKISLRTGIEVQRVESDHLVTNEGDLPFDLCLWAGSFRSASLGRESGLAVNGKDQVLVDETLRSLTAPEIYVAGDSASLPAAYSPYLVMGCKTAMPQGIHTAENLLAELRGEQPQPLRYHYTVTCVSLGRNDGLIQVLEPNGQPKANFVRGALAAWVKETICRFTVLSLFLERNFNFYDWFMPPQPKVATAQTQPTPHSQSI